MENRFDAFPHPLEAVDIEAVERLGPFLAVGDASAVLERVREYVAAGCSKFVMLPLASEAKDVFEQTRQLIAEVIPAANALPGPLAA